MCPVAAKLFSCPPTTLELGVISSVQGQHEEEPSLVVVGGGAAGVYASIRAKTLAPRLNVAVVEKGRFLSKVKISGGGRCNVTNGHHIEPMVMSTYASYSYPGLSRWWCLRPSSGLSLPFSCCCKEYQQCPLLCCLQGLARNYPRGDKELRGSFFTTHGPQDTMRWFTDHGVDLKVAS